MTRAEYILSFVACLMVASVLGGEAADRADEATGRRDTSLRDMLVINEDNSHFFGSRKPDDMTLAGLHAFVDQYAGSAVTHLYLCPNAMRASFRSRSRDAIWDPVDGKEPQGMWPQNAKRLAEAGLDPYKIWISRCREKGVSPWLTMRMNDVHDVGKVDSYMHSSFWRKHREYWRVPNGSAGPWVNRAMNAPRRHPVCFRDTVPSGFPNGAQLPADARDGGNFRIHIGPKPDSGKVWAIAGLGQRDGVAEAKFEATLNGQALSAAENVENPQGFGGGTVRAVRFPCPMDAVKDGYNDLNIRQVAGSVAQSIVWVEIRVEP